MKRLFGKKKEVAPPPTLDDATGSLEKRGDGVDAKIKKLDLELARHREIIKKARPGPARDAAKRRALQVLKQTPRLKLQNRLEQCQITRKVRPKSKLTLYDLWLCIASIQAQTLD